MDKSNYRWRDFLATILLFLLFTIAFNRLIVTKWTSHLDITRSIAYLGLIAGLALGFSKFSPRVCFLFAFCYGCFTIPWRLGLSISDSIIWNERLIAIWSRVLLTLSFLFQKRPVSDNLLFISLMCILFWILSVHAGYTLIRHAEPWKIIIPTGLALVLFHTYDSFYSWRVIYLVLYIFFSLILVARLYYLQNRNRWISNRTYLPPNLGLDILKITSIALVILLILAWVVPVKAENIQSATDLWRHVKQPFRGISDSLDNAFASLKSTMGVVSDYYGTNLVLGRGNRLSDEEIFTVLPTEDPPRGTRYYWRARVYDKYEDGKWTSSLTINESVDPDNFEVAIPKFNLRASGHYLFYFTSSHAISTIFTTGQPLWISIPSKLELQYNPDRTADIGSIRASPSLHLGDTYYLRSSLSGANIRIMRDSQTTYPDWVVDRYLQIPPIISDRTIRLAQDITEGFVTPYDKANAITNYLRENITYEESLSELSQNQEPIDWFLFDHKKGFCNYYASAEVILLRAVGVPARLVAGYAQGEYDDYAQTYVIRQKDAHAWPEVFFSDLGWVEFEPTVSQPVLIRPSGEITSAALGNDPIIPDEKPDPGDQDDISGPQPITPLPGEHQIGILTIVLATLILLGFFALRYFSLRTNQDQRKPIPVLLERGIRRLGFTPPSLLTQWAQRSTRSHITNAYIEINRALKRLGHSPSQSETPTERVATLISSIPETFIPANTILKEYNLAQYSSMPANNDSACQAGYLVRSLSRRKQFQDLVFRKLSTR